MPAHIVKCKFCGKQFDRDITPCIYIEKSRRYAHKECPEGNSAEVQWEKDRDTLANYILDKYGKEVYNDPKVWVQIERFYKQNLTPIGIYNCLFYMSTILNKNIQKGNLGLVPYYYKEANDYFNKMQQVQVTNKEKIAETTSTFYKEIEVSIVSPQRKRQKKLLFSFLDKEE